MRGGLRRHPGTARDGARRERPADLRTPEVSGQAGGRETATGARGEETLGRRGRAVREQAGSVRADVDAAKGGCGLRQDQVRYRDTEDREQGQYDGQYHSGVGECSQS